MKKRTYLKVMLSALALILLCFYSCKQTTPPPTTAEGPGAKPTCDTLVCDTCGIGDLSSVKITDPYIYYRLHDWKRKKEYTLCISVTLSKDVEKVEVLISNAKPTRHEVIKAIVLAGNQKVYYLHLKSRISPDISVVYRKGGGVAPEYGTFATTTDSACGLKQTIQDNVKSTSTQNSTVLVSIDEN